MYEKKLNFKQDIDVRGMRGDEALQAITYFVDDAILVAWTVYVFFTEQEPEYSVHSSANTCPPYRAVSHYADEHVQFGGAGITVVDFD